VADISRRKDEHLDIVLTRDVGPRMGGTGFEAIRFEHVALPEIALDDIDLGVTFLNRTMSAPLLISSMTGGPARAEAVNIAIAEAAQHLRLGFGVGSQRVALEGAGDNGLTTRLRAIAPHVPLLANIGGAQLASAEGLALGRRAVDMIGADALIIHLNPLQEAVQAGGDTDWRGVLAGIESLAGRVAVPIVVKEVGAGLSGRMAQRLWNAGVRVLDVAGSGGTSWAAVESERADNAKTRSIGAAFRDWGIPTAIAIRDVRRACPEAVVIASGGIRDGVDVARAIRLGANLTAQAAGVLAAAVAGTDSLVTHLETVIAQLRVACFCTGSANLDALSRAPLLADSTRPNP
jgi:isopentenyl-diphosphate delta-isomerase